MGLAQIQEVKWLCLHVASWVPMTSILTNNSVIEMNVIIANYDDDHS